MKKNMIIIASASVLLLLLGTCSIRRFYYTSFVWAYYQPDSLVLTCYEKTAFAIDFNISREEFYANHVSQESEGLKKRNLIHSVGDTMISDTIDGLAHQLVV